MHVIYERRDIYSGLSGYTASEMNSNTINWHLVWTFIHWEVTRFQGGLAGSFPGWVWNVSVHPETSAQDQREEIRPGSLGYRGQIHTTDCSWSEPPLIEAEKLKRDGKKYF